MANKILCFDTSNNNCFVSVSDGQEILSYNQETKPSMQAETLIPLIELSLKQANLDYADIDYLATTVGPGSFTGIRVGLATATSILHATKMIGIGINNFETHYYRLKGQIKSFDRAFIVINAYRNQQYIQEFSNKKAISEPKLCSNEEVVEMIKESSKDKVTACAGSGLSSIYQELKSLQNLIILPRFLNIKSYQIARLADKLISKDQITPIEPLYIRPPDAIIPKKFIA